MGSLDWFELAHCRQKPEIFFGQNNPDKARSICNECPVSDLCLLWALTSEHPDKQYKYGIFGGKTPIERYELGKLINSSRARELYEIELKRWGLIT